MYKFYYCLSISRINKFHVEVKSVARLSKTLGISNEFWPKDEYHHQINLEYTRYQKIRQYHLNIRQST